MKYLTIILGLTLILPNLVLAQTATLESNSGSKATITSGSGDPASITSNGERPSDALNTNQNKQVSAPSKITAGFTNPLEVNSITELFYKILYFIIQISYIIIAFALIWNGFLLITAQGNQDKLNDVKRSILHVFVGGFIIMGINVIIKVLETTLKSLQ